MSVAGYGRASTSRQVESPHVQEEMIRKYAEARGLCKYDDVIMYIDPATSGKTSIDRREAGGLMCKSLRKGDSVIFTKLDRGFRSLINFVEVIDTWANEGVEVHILNFPGGHLDLSSPVGRLLLRILAVFAEFERELISQRIKEAYEARRLSGIRTNIKAPFGYMLSGRRKYHKLARKYLHVVEPNEPMREVAREVVLVKNTTDMTWQQIADLFEHVQVPGLKKITKGTVHRMYHKMIALGLVNPDGTPKPGWVDDKQALTLRARLLEAGVEIK
jgi:DNA invertase Pin-like site-specific DNA recombinase